MGVLWKRIPGDISMHAHFIFALFSPYILVEKRPARWNGSATEFASRQVPSPIEFNTFARSWTGLESSPVPALDLSFIVRARNIGLEREVAWRRRGRTTSGRTSFVCDWNLLRRNTGWSPMGRLHFDHFAAWTRGWLKADARLLSDRSRKTCSPLFLEISTREDGFRASLPAPRDSDHDQYAFICFNTLHTLCSAYYEYIFGCTSYLVLQATSCISYNSSCIDLEFVRTFFSLRRICEKRTFRERGLKGGSAWTVYKDFVKFEKQSRELWKIILPWTEVYLTILFFLLREKSSLCRKRIFTTRGTIFLLQLATDVNLQLTQKNHSLLQLSILRVFRIEISKV